MEALDIWQTAAVEAPLTEAQAGLWYAQRLDPDNPIFNTGQFIELTGTVDMAALRTAIGRMIQEADTLATRIVDGPDGPSQMIDDRFRPLLEEIDLSDLPLPRDAALAAMAVDMERPVDFACMSLAAEKLFKISDGHVIWYQRIHHLAIDGYGTILLTNRVAALYNALVLGNHSKQLLPSIRLVYTEDAAYRSSEKRSLDAAYWRNCFTELPNVTSLAAGRAVTSRSFLRHQAKLDAADTAKLQTMTRLLRLAWPDIATALIAAYCRRYAGTEDIVIGVPYMDRFGRSAAGVPTTLTNILPIRFASDEEAPLIAVLQSFAKDITEARRHGRYRSEQLRRDLGLLGGQKRLYGPLINVLPFEHVPQFSGVAADLTILGTGPVDDITFTLRGGSESITLEIDVNPTLYSQDDLEQHGSRLAAFIKAALDAHTLADVPLAGPCEMASFITDLEETKKPLPSICLSSLIESTMRERADKSAVRFESGSLTYAALDIRSRALAAFLKQKGVKADSLVAVALPRSLELVIALVAVIRAGAAYLPLDLGHPPERLRSILQSAKPVMALASREDFSIFENEVSVLAPLDWPVEEDSTLDIEIHPDDAAYVIYTSGSTGQPKGVVIEHRAIVNRLLWMRNHYDIGHDDRILQKTPATFDVSVWEFFLPLISGAELVVAPPEAHKDPAALVEIIERHAITALHFVPSMLAAFLAEPSVRNMRIAKVFCSGEELPADLRDQFHQIMHGELHNLYGPTEAAVDVSFWPANRDDRTCPVPIGFPVWNTRLYVLDDKMRVLPPNVVGHLFLAGVQLARGYLGRPDLTEERFVPDPFIPGERMYKTGDLAKRLDNGAFVFLGRSDHQVKIRGLRIELGEIESVLLSSGLIKQVHVIAREDKPGDKRLVAYFLSNDHCSVEDLRRVVAEKLPDYMVPKAFIALDAFPTTSNGKLDRAALPCPDYDVAEGRSLATQTELRLAGLFRTILRLDKELTAEADFFSLGGDSLLAVRLVQNVRDIWGLDLGLGRLFESATIAALARAIDQGACEADHGTASTITLHSSIAKRPPLFFIHPAGGICWCYRELAHLIEPERPIYGLQAPMLDPHIVTPASLVRLSHDYVEEILRLYPEGPYHLAGWSVGGILAQAMAAELQEKHRSVGVVGLLDSYPSDCWRDAPEAGETEAAKALIGIAGYDPDQYPHLTTWAETIAFLRGSDCVLGRLPDQTFHGIMRVILESNRLVRSHRHSSFDGAILHFRAALDHAGSNLSPDHWKPYASDITVIDIPSLHAHMTGRDASRLIAPELSKRLIEADITFGASLVL